MKKLVALGAGLAAAGSAALISAGVAVSDPASTSSGVNVVGQPYAKALQVLKSQGVKATFGGSVGSALPQSQCMVDQQKVNGSGHMLLMLDCTEKAKQQMKDSSPSAGGGGAPAAPGGGAPGGAPGAPGAPNVGANGVTTVTPTPVGPVPGMMPPG